MENEIIQVPQALQDIEELNTPEKIKEQMKQNILTQSSGIPQENTVVYNVTLMVNTDGTGWQEASEENFPSEGLVITLPYPDGTGKDTHDFVVCHMFTEDMNGHHAGETEYPAVTKTEEGIQIKIHGLSPISVGWKEIVQVDDAGTPKPQEPVNSGNQETEADSPKTEDGSHIEWYFLTFVLSAGILGILGLSHLRRKKKK